MLSRAARPVRRLRRRLTGNGAVGQDAGMVMILVVSMALVLTLMISGLLAVGLTGTATARHRQDYPAAVEAALAGVDDYLTHLNFSPTNYVPDASNLALSSWQPVPGSNNGAQFRYWLDTTTSDTSGTVTVVSSGRVNGTVRTVRAGLRVSSFGDYLYFTDYETIDPLAGGSSTCTKNGYAWQQARPSGCNIYFRGSGASYDDLDGKVHSNDEIAISGNPHFESTVETGAPDGAYNSDGTAAPVFNGQPNKTKHQEVIPLPVGNNDLLTAARTSYVGKTGCVFTGPTKIRFVAGSGATPGYLMVTSPNTTAGSNPGADCGTWPSSRLGSGAPQPEQQVALPGNGVVYVQNLASGTGTCLTEFERVPNDNSSYNCNYGDAFVHGTLTGQVTVGAYNNIYVTNNLRDDTSDPKSVMGLIARNFVYVWHPVSCGAYTSSTTCNLQVATTESGATVLSPPTSVTVDALILADYDSFVVQNYDAGSTLGTLKVRGGIIQKYRGVVGTTQQYGVTGYTKYYTYDTRLRGLLPPHFSKPGSIVWSLDSYSEDQARTS